jgi:transcriptional regulator with XRE-family HTH domain
MQGPSAPEPELSETCPYPLGVARGRRLSKPRPRQGARLAAFRQAAGLTQIELAKLIGESQQNVAFWEQSEKPPRSDVLPKMAKVLGVRVEALLGEEIPRFHRSGPVGRVQKIFEEVSKLPRRQQDRIAETVSALVAQYKRGA